SSAPRRPSSSGRCGSGPSGSCAPSRPRSAPRPPDEPVGTSKHELRLALRQVRDAIPAELAGPAAEAAAGHLAGLPALAGARTVALYAPVRGELDPRPAAHLLRRRGVALAYPRVRKQERLLGFHLVADEGHMVPGPFGILEPAPDCPALELG